MGLRFDIEVLRKCSAFFEKPAQISVVVFLLYRCLAVEKGYLMYEISSKIVL